MKRIVLVALLALSAGRVGRTDTPPPSLADFFRPGVVFQDRNGDGAVDFVDARIALAEHPTAGELAAAADVAARLGFETSAMNLPVPRASDDGTRAPEASGSAATIFIGAKSLPRSEERRVGKECKCRRPQYS